MRDFLERPIAHRGLHNENQIIENTLEAFENAIQNDYLIECDVVLSKDHEVLVFHDYDLKRLCNIERYIADISSKELININLLNTKSKIPTLEEMFYLVNGRVPILIEIKKNFNPFIEERLLELTRTYQGEIAFQSFDIKACEWFRDNAPYYKTGLIVNDKIIDENEINKLNIKFIAVDVEILMREDIQALRKNNFPTLTWTIDNERNYKLSKEIQEISATKIRAKMREEGKLK